MQQTTTSATSTSPRSLTSDQRSLVEQHLDLVKRIARPWRSRCRTSVEHADLVQAGALGLVEAARRYDPARHDTFGALAADRIRGSIRDALRALDPLPRGRRRAVRRLEQARLEARGALGREPSDEQLASRLGWTVEHVRRAQADVHALAAGWAQTMEAPDRLAPDADGSSPHEHALLRDELREQLAAAISELPSRHATLLSLYYEEGLTMREVGEVLGVTESRVCQLHATAVRALRESMSSRYEGVRIPA